jgi:hypothetical protein
MGDLDQALAHLRQAIAEAEAAGTGFDHPDQFNALVEAAQLIYVKRGQAGMARLVAKKRR